MIFIIIGLGNPGKEYDNTRHNAGRFMLEAFAKTNNFPEFSPDKKLNALISEGEVGGTPVLLVEPETFMNNSGDSLKKIHDLRFKIQDKDKKKEKEIENLAVIHDDLDIPFGKFKISFNKSSGGHKGVESIINVVKTQAFVRIRVGICPNSSFLKGGARAPEGGGFELNKPQGAEAVDKFILGKFSPAEISTLQSLSQKISSALSILVAEGREKAMGEFNG